MLDGIVALRRAGPTSEQTEIASPRVGYWRGAPAVGTIVRAGEALGVIETLGVRYPVVAPDGVEGVVVRVAAPDLARKPVGFGDVLAVIDRSVVGASKDPSADAGGSADEQTGGLVFVSPMSGRFYARPGPDKPPFVEPGQTLKTGDSIGLLEVMKTFNRLTYGGAKLPPTARIKRVVPADGDDLNGGDPILELEAD